MNSFSRGNMWDSEYRPEQEFTRNFLADLNPTWTIKQEYRITKLTLDGKPHNPCTLDIAISKPKKIAIRLNGGYHFVSNLQRRKDEFQKEALIQAGWIVLDFDHYRMPNLFKKNKNNETIKLAQNEIIKYLGKV